MRMLAFVRGAVLLLCLSVGGAGCADEDWPTSKPHDGGGASDVTTDMRFGDDRVIAPDGGRDAKGPSDGGGIVDNAGGGPDISVVPEGGTRDAMNDVGGGGEATPISTICNPSRSSEPIPARTVAMSNDAVGGDVTL